MARIQKLTVKQQLFIKEYLVDHNATQACIRAGYSKANADKIGPQLLGHSRVRAEIDSALAVETKKIEKRLAAKSITKERWLAKLAEIAFGTMDDHASVKKGIVKLFDSTARAKRKGHAIKKLTQSWSTNGGSTGIELHNPIPALELLGKHLAWIKERVEHSGPDGKPMQIETLTPEERKAEMDRLKAILETAGED